MLLLWTLLLTTDLLERQKKVAENCTPPPGSKNWAKNCPARQSSTYAQWGTVLSGADSAVDGNREGDWSRGSCSHTTRESQPWWRVDLGSRFAVTAVVVKNRQDCCAERLKGAVVHVGDLVTHHGMCNPVCGTITNGSAGSLSILCCRGHKGRYVSITIPGREEYLTLCEVEVYGSWLVDQC